VQACSPAQGTPPNAAPSPNAIAVHPSQRYLYVGSTSGKLLFAVSGRPTASGDPIDWQSPEDNVVLQAAKKRTIPAIVISNDIASAFRFAKADLYLEKPVEATELAMLLLEMMQAAEVLRTGEIIKHSTAAAK